MLRDSKAKLWGVTFVLFACMVAVSFRLSSLLTPQRRTVRYIPSTSYLLLASGSYRPLGAELIFIKAVLDFTERFPEKLRYLMGLCETAIHLDAKIKSAYFLGGVVFPQKKTDLAEGARFLKRTLAYDPLNWRLPYWVGFNYYQLGDYLRAARYYQIAVALPGAPNFLRTNQAMFYYNAERPDLGARYFEGLLESISEPRLMELVENKLYWFKSLLLLESKVSEFKARFGRVPEDLDELVEKELIKQVPEDTFGRGFYFDPEAYKQGSQFGVRSRF